MDYGQKEIKIFDLYIKYFRLIGTFTFLQPGIFAICNFTTTCAV